MHDDHVFELTARGQAELRGSATALSPREIELLVRIDGNQTVADLRQSMASGEADGSFDATLAELRRAGLIAVADRDAFALQLQEDWNKLALAAGRSEADARLASLTRHGYHVGFGRRRFTRPPEGAHALRAVVVEDDPQFASFVATLLALDGFQTTTAACRAEVLAAFRQRPVPDLILLDVTLPDVGGFDILASLRRHAAFDEVPVIMVTGKTTRAAVLQGLAGGADGYITKPFDPQTLETVVRGVAALPPAPGTAA